MTDGEPAPARSSILYVEDNEANAALVVHLVRRMMPVEIVIAPDGRSALDLVQSRDFSLLILDLGLPDISGREVLRQLRADERTHLLPVLVATADASGVTASEVKGLDVQGFVTKPFDLLRFVETCKRLLAA